MSDLLTSTHQKLRAAQLAFAKAQRSGDADAFDAAVRRLIRARQAHAAAQRDPYRAATSTRKEAPDAVRTN